MGGWTVRLSHDADPAWAEATVVILGHSVAEPDARFVFALVAQDAQPRLRLKIQCETDGGRRDATVWLDWIVIGNCADLHLYSTTDGTVRTITLEEGWFQGFVVGSEYLLVLTDYGIHRVNPDGLLAWRNTQLGDTEVALVDIRDGVINGWGDFDFPRGKKEWMVSLLDGRLLMPLRKNLAEQIYDGEDGAREELAAKLEHAGLSAAMRSTFDDYDASVEFHDAEPSLRLTEAQQLAIHDAGFHVAYVNHTDGWETHYTVVRRGVFSLSMGWRVSYPHKRGDSNGSIWTEAVVEGWPEDWLECGRYAIKPPAKY